MKEQATLRLCGFGPLSQTESYRWGPGMQGVYVIHYIVKGRGFFETDGKRYAVGAGESFLIYPDQTVQYYPDPEDPWEYRWVNFTGYEAQDLIAMTAFPENPICPKHKAFAGLYTRFAKENQYRHAQLYNIGLLQILLAEYMRIYPASRTERTPDYMDYARRCVDADCHRPDFGVRELAQAVGLERSYLYRIFMDAEGVSPKQYIIDVRMRHAVQMMQRGITSIQLISRSVGYDDPLYFSHAFKKKFGISPRNYMLVNLA